MTDQRKTLKDEIKEIRRSRSVSPEDFEMMTGIPLEVAKKLKDGDKFIERFKLSYTPHSLRILAGTVTELIEIIDHFLSVLGEKKLGFGGLARGAELRAKFEFSAYLLFVLDVFATQHQTHESRLEIFYVVSNEVLEALQQISPEYQESEFNKDLDKRMDQYGAFIREPDTIFKVPPDVSVWGLLQENLTKAVAKGGFEKKEIGKGELTDFLLGKKRMTDKNKPLDIVSVAYGATCHRAAERYRFIIVELFTATEDIRHLSVNDLDRILKEATAKIARLDEEDRNTES